MAAVLPDDVPAPEPAAPEAGAPAAAVDATAGALEPGQHESMTEAAEVAELVGGGTHVPTDEGPQEPAGSDQQQGPARAVLALLSGSGLLVIALIGLLIYALVNRPTGVASPSTRASAVSAATADAKIIFSYDYQHIDANFAAGLAVSTGSFKAEYTKTTGALAKDLVPKYKGSLVADVSTAGVISASHDAVVVLVFLNLQSSSTLHATPTVTPDRIEMTMVRHGKGWLVSAIKAR